MTIPKQRLTPFFKYKEPIKQMLVNMETNKERMR